MNYSLVSFYPTNDDKDDDYLRWSSFTTQMMMEILVIYGSALWLDFGILDLNFDSCEPNRDKNHSCSLLNQFIFHFK